MQIVDTPQNFIEGIFVKELKNRFLCEVIIDGVSTICYVPSSCHLSNFLSLEGKQVLLSRFDQIFLANFSLVPDGLCTGLAR